MSGVRPRLFAAGLIAIGSVVAVLGSAGAQETVAGGPTGGEAVYDYWCATCHAAGPNMPGTQALAAKYGGDPAAVLTERPDLTPEFIELIVRSGISVMPPFRKTEITDAELATLSEFIVATARSAGSD